MQPFLLRGSEHLRSTVGELWTGRAEIYYVKTMTNQGLVSVYVIKGKFTGRTSCLIHRNTYFINNYTKVSEPAFIANGLIIF